MNIYRISWMQDQRYRHSAAVVASDEKAALSELAMGSEFGADFNSDIHISLIGESASGPGIIRHESM